jgi:hypothetical protein
MAQWGKTGERQSPSARIPRLIASVIRVVRVLRRLSPLVLLLAGCSQMNRNIAPTAPQPPSDPLLGGPPMKTTQAPPAPKPATLAKPESAVTTLPPLSAPGATPSTAALAAGAQVQPMDGGRDLRIGDPPGKSGTWVGQNEPVSNGSGALLRQPETTAAAPNPPTPAVSQVSLPANRSTGLDDALKQLKDRGVVWQRLDVVAETGEWKFSCSVPNRQNPNVRRTYEARAKEPLAAVQSVLARIDSEQGR